MIHIYLSIYLSIKRLAAASDMWSCGCSDPWSKKHISLLPSKMGFWMEKSALLTVFKSEHFTVGCNSWTWCGLGPWSWGNSGPGNLIQPSPGHTGLGQPDLEPRPQSSPPIVLVIIQLSLPSPGLTSNQVWQCTHLLFCLSAWKKKKKMKWCHKGVRMYFFSLTLLFLLCSRGYIPQTKN